MRLPLPRVLFRCFSLFVGASLCGGATAGSGRSEWVYADAGGRLAYKTTAAGDRIMDFSHAGYRGGGVALPDVPVRATVKPSGGEDDTAAIQAAINEVAALPLRDGFRGAVLLAPGTFTCAQTIVLSTSGVVLRGSGSGEGGTTIRMTGSRHPAFVIGRPRQARVPRSDDDEDGPANGNAEPAAVVTETTIADAYVPAGTFRFAVADAKSFSVGDLIAIRRPTTEAWLKLMEMDTLKRDGRSQTWIGTNRGGVTERRIVAIDDNTFTLDVPLADSYDARYLNPPGTIIAKLQPQPRITNVGIERLHVQCPPLEISYGQAPYSGARVGGDDCWVRDVFFEETMNTTTLAGKRITMERVRVKHTFPNLGASKPADFSIEGSQILIDRCEVTGGNTYFVWTASLYPGPNVVLNSTFRGHGSRIQPHMRWSTGLLLDNCTVPDGGIDFPNRGVTGSGHGWTMGWGVAWNCIADFYVIQQPPGAANWAIGCIGNRVQTARYFDTTPLLPEGIFDSHGTPVAPQSLYLAQLEERLGLGALKAIGYDGGNASEFANKSVPRLPPLPRDDDPELGPDLALHRPVNTSNIRRSEKWREFAGERALDADPATYWATNDNLPRAATFEVDMEGPVEINAVTLTEMPGMTGRVQSYKVEGQVDSDWKLLAEGTTIGERAVHRFSNETVWKVRLTVLKAEPFAAIKKVGIYAEKR